MLCLLRDLAKRRLIGISIQCAEWTGDKLALSDGATVPLGNAQLVWTTDPTVALDSYKCPVYLFSDREHLLLTVNLAAKGSPDMMVQSGVALLAAD